MCASKFLSLMLYFSPIELNIFGQSEQLSSEVSTIFRGAEPGTKRKNATERAYIKLTISTSEGMRDRKSASSLLSTAFGLRIFFVNLFIPFETTKRLNNLVKLDYNTQILNPWKEQRGAVKLV